VLAPLPVNVAVWPEQISVVLGVMVNTGVTFTEILCIAELVHEFKAVPVNV
jgi:hypothetical protein